MIKFRKRIKIMKGVKVNITAKGISSVSLGVNGATINLSKKGAKATVGVPGTGLSYSKNITTTSNNISTPPISYDSSSNSKEVSILLGVGILIMPYVFSWLLLKAGYSLFARLVGFSWLMFWFYLMVIKP